MGKLVCRTKRFAYAHQLVRSAIVLIFGGVVWYIATVIIMFVIGRDGMATALVSMLGGALAGYAVVRAGMGRQWGEWAAEPYRTNADGTDAWVPFRVLAGVLCVITLAGMMLFFRMGGYWRYLAPCGLWQAWWAGQLR